MSAETHSNEHTNLEPAEGATSELDAATPSDRSEPLDAHPAVEIDLKPSAHCCGALGCRETDVLLEVVIDDYGTRVTCPNHAEHLIGREAE
jgi:hypothetical protein